MRTLVGTEEVIEMVWPTPPEPPVPPVGAIPPSSDPADP